MSDYFVTLKIQHGRLKAAMQEKGIRTPCQLARVSGSTYQSVLDLFRFKRTPMDRHGHWRPVVLQICSFLGKEPDELFPPHLHHEAQKNTFEAFVEREQLEGLTTRQLPPSSEIEREEMTQVLDEVLDTLPEKDSTLLRALYLDEKDSNQVAREQGIPSRQCAWARTKTIMRRLRRSSKTMRKLAEVMP
jgi:DNA-directed RNA polymerase specialized sigma subunit